MAKLEFYLTSEDIDRLYAIKQLQGKDDLTGNSFAAELLHRAIVELFPARADFDEMGKVTNPQCYKGGNI